MGEAERKLVGRWRLIETELWDVESLDLVGPAHIRFGRDGLGEMHFIALSADVDYRVVESGDTLRGRIFNHRGDDSGFVARREDA